MNATSLIVIGSLCLFALIFDGVFLGIIFFTRRKVTQASNWSSTMGTVLSSTIEWHRRSEGGSVAYPSVQYSYQVMGQMLQGSKIMPGPPVGGSGAKKVVARYPAGAQVMVYYDPNNPSDAVLERNMPGHITWLWVTLVLVDIFLCGLGTFLYFIL